MAKLMTVALISDLPPGRAIAFEGEGRQIAVFNVGGACLAIDDTCTHAGASLCEGEVENSVVTCPWHRGTFELRAGQCLGPPADESVRTYRVSVEGDDLTGEL
jgi:nitrite reductase/ring-hydroxylating ferredoxin subunit